MTNTLLSTVLLLSLTGAVFGWHKHMHSSLHRDVITADYPTFELWMQEFDIEYKKAEIKAKKFEIWTSRIAKIKAHNANPKNTWKMGVNEFTAHDKKELKSLLMSTQNCSATDHHYGLKPIDLNKLIESGNLSQPDQIDWRDEKVISEVKNQGNCGSCWTFSTTGCLEAHHAINTGQIIELSEQNLVDCANAFNNFGCDGGLPSQAFEYIKYNGGLNTEFSYPYNGTTGIKCKYSSKTGTVGVVVDDVYNITQYDENEIYTAVGTTGPVSIAYDVVDDFFSYESGIYQSTECGNTTSTVNHAVLIVGYGSNPLYSEGMPYWIVKNSWGWGWGDEGYFLIERGVNMCGLSSCASFPLLEG